MTTEQMADVYVAQVKENFERIKPGHNMFVLDKEQLLLIARRAFLSGAESAYEEVKRAFDEEVI